MDTIEKDNLTGTNNGPLLPNFPLKYLTATSVMGDKVENTKGEPMGTIKDIMLDISGGKISYYVIEFGGFLGLGTKYFAVPSDRLQVNAAKQVFVCNLSREVLEKAPGFDDDHWPNTNIHFEQLQSHWSFMG